MSLILDIVTPRGVELHEEGLERVVVRRREELHDPGSEVAICPRHGPLLMQTQTCTLRLTKDGHTTTVEAEPGVLEVWRDTITLAVT